MARKNSISYPIKPQAPETLDNNPFYGIQCDEYQKKFRDAIWNPEKLIVFCNAKAGTGKTTIAAATANLLCEYGLYDGIVYIAAPPRNKSKGIWPALLKKSLNRILNRFMRRCSKLE